MSWMLITRGTFLREQSAVTIPKAKRGHVFTYTKSGFIHRLSITALSPKDKFSNNRLVAVEVVEKNEKTRISWYPLQQK